MKDDTKQKLTELVNEQIDKDVDITKCILYIPAEMMDQFPVGELIYGMQVRIGKEFAIKPKEETVTTTPTGAPTRASDRIYWFRGQDGTPFYLEEQAAWDTFTSNGSWKYKAPYLGVTHKNDILKLTKDIREKYPIDSETIRVINENEGGAVKGKAERELRKADVQHKQMYDEGIKSIAATADPSIKPPNKDYIFGDDMMSPAQQSLVRSVTGRN